MIDEPRKAQNDKNCLALRLGSFSILIYKRGSRI